MIRGKYGLKGLIVSWLADCRAAIAMEAAMFVPILFVMLVGVYDIGTGILVNQKVINAAQMSADLVAREISMNDAQVEDVMAAAQLAMMPLPLNRMGIAIVSLQYEDNGDPKILWQEISGRATGLDINDQEIQDAVGLGIAGDGLIVTVVTYQYDPVFSGSFLPAIEMHEAAYARGRRLPVITRVN